LDGLLFSLAGLLFAFTLFFGMFILGLCGGGDVKLCAAIGAWIGAVYTIFLLLATVVALAAWFALKMLTGGRKWMQDARKLRQAKRNPRKASELPRGRITFSLPAVVAAAAVMLWVFRVDLQLAPVRPAPTNEGNHASAASPNP
jgi:prepilin peptidase CpaA